MISQNSARHSMSRFPDEGRCSSRSRSPRRDEREGSSPRDARLDDVFRHATPHRDVAIVTAGMDAPEITRGIGKVFLLPTSSARVAVRRYRAVTWQRSPERPDATRLGNSTTARSAARRTQPRDQFGRLMFFERGLGVRATRMPPTSTQFSTDLRASGTGRAFRRIGGLPDRPSW